jgi:hypothetical protein
MTKEELLEEIRRLPLKQRVEILAALSENIRKEERGTEGEGYDKQEKLAALERLRGLLKFESGPATDEQVKDMITDYLTEKYS